MIINIIRIWSMFPATACEEHYCKYHNLNSGENGGSARSGGVNEYLTS